MRETTHEVATGLAMLDPPDDHECAAEDGEDQPAAESPCARAQRQRNREREEHRVAMVLLHHGARSEDG